TKANSIDQASGTIARSAHGAGDCFRTLSTDEQSVTAQMKKKQIIIGSLAILLIIGGLVWVAQRFGIGKEETKTGPVPQVQVAKKQGRSAAEKPAREGEAQRTAWQRAGAGGDKRSQSDIAGVIAKVDAQDGQIVPAGGPLVEIVAENEIEVKLGVEAEDLSAAQEGAPITVVPVNDPTAAKVQGTVRLVTRRIDPTTRLVDVYVALPEGTKLLLDGYVRGEIQRTEKGAVVVPRSAGL